MSKMSLITYSMKDFMEDNLQIYKKMYLKLMRETEKAIEILVQAQQDCEELYLTAGDHGEKEA